MKRRAVIILITAVIALSALPDYGAWACEGTLPPCEEVQAYIEPAEAAEAAESEGKGLFKKALEDLSAEKYVEAVGGFDAAAEKLHAVGDYALFYSAKASIKAGDDASAVGSLEKLLAEHPKSPLRKSASETLIRALFDLDEAKALPLLESHVKDYPDGEEMKYILAMKLKDKDPAKARILFRELYIGAGGFSKTAMKELGPDGIAPEDAVKMALNLIKASRYGEAESALRGILKDKKDESENKDALDALALSLFRQKRYKEAGEAYLKVEDLYLAALSFFRAGEYASFDRTLERLASKGDKRAGSLLVSYAGDKRRKGNMKEALKILSSVEEAYPSEREQALWQTGWTYYTEGNFEKAFSVFTALSRSYRDGRYTYWRARTAERLNEDAKHIYAEIENNGDFYGLLARLKTGRAAKGLTASQGLTASHKDIASEKSGSPSDGKLFERFEILRELGLRKEAASELVHAARGLATEGEVLAAAYRLREAGEYRRAISLILGLPEAKRPLEILYPPAFGAEVESACSGISLDPHLVLSVIREESRYDPEALSQAGAIGVMQLMPKTAERLARSLGVEFGGAKEIYDVGLNIRLGSYYLSRLLGEFGSVPPALAAYNAGEQRVREWLGRRDYGSYDEFIEDIPYKETREYVKRILTSYFRYRELSAGEADMSEKATSPGTVQSSLLNPL